MKRLERRVKKEGASILFMVCGLLLPSPPLFAEGLQPGANFYYGLTSNSYDEQQRYSAATAYITPFNNLSLSGSIDGTHYSGENRSYDSSEGLAGSLYLFNEWGQLGVSLAKTRYQLPDNTPVSVISQFEQITQSLFVEKFFPNGAVQLSYMHSDAQDLPLSINPAVNINRQWVNDFYLARSEIATLAATYYLNASWMIYAGIDGLDAAGAGAASVYFTPPKLPALGFNLDAGVDGDFYWFSSGVSLSFY